jgi:Putative ABC-transporter type IV
MARLHLAGMLRRFVAYGVMGLGIEVGFTGAVRGIFQRDRRLRGESFLWMLPIYGAGGLLLERLHGRLRSRGMGRAARALCGTAAIYGIEYISGAALEQVTGECPWRYRRGLHVNGYVRLDYAPFWFACALAADLLAGELRKLDRQRRTADRRLSARGAGAGAASPDREERRRAARRASDRRLPDRATPPQAPAFSAAPARPRGASRAS